MTQTPQEPQEDATHLDVEPYDETERVEAPDWYDDTVNVGDLANVEAEE